MREDFIHYLWRHARFDLRHLRTTTGEELSIQHFGKHNPDAGPDFSGGQIRIAGMHWAGNIEMHVNASEWYQHGHQNDPAYDNVVLHVVFTEDQPVYRRDGQRIPCLELNDRVPPGLFNSYWRLLHNENWIPCQNRLYEVPGDVRKAWLSELTTVRLRNRSRRFTDLLEHNGRDWEATFYQSLARALGGRVNAEAMEMLARSLPLRILLRHKHSLLQLEALCFGQASLIPLKEDEEGAYVSLLRREYALLRIKYELQPIPATAWRYLRLRPNSFPTIRIAQLAAMLHRTGQLFGKALAAADHREMINMFEVELSNYWSTHYRFGKEATAGKRRLGIATVRSILINTIAPALQAYGTYRMDERFGQRAAALLKALPPEDNKIIRRWAALGVDADTAAESQALLELKTSYCEPTRCTECALGCHLLAQGYESGGGPLLTLNEEARIYAMTGA